MDPSPACRRLRRSRSLIGRALAVAAAFAFGAPAAYAESPACTCSRVGTDDTLRTVPASLGPAVNAVFGTRMPPAEAARMTSYRCYRGQVLLCTVGANLPCGKANVSRRLPRADAWCRENPNADFIPAAATGHDTIFEWRCAGQKAAVAKQTGQVDARGFFKEYWKALR
jgi:hypothetical protein